MELLLACLILELNLRMPLMMSEDLGFLGFLFERDEIAQIREKIASVGSEVSSVCFV